MGHRKIKVAALLCGEVHRCPTMCHLQHSTLATPQAWPPSTVYITTLSLVRIGTKWAMTHISKYDTNGNQGTEIICLETRDRRHQTESLGCVGLDGVSYQGTSKAWLLAVFRIRVIARVVLLFAPFSCVCEVYSCMHIMFACVGHTWWQCTVCTEPAS